MKTIVLKFLVFTLLIFSNYLHAQHNVLDQTFNVIKVNDSISMLKGKGGNVAVFAGEDGVLIVDDNYKDMSTALDARGIVCGLY